MSVSRVLTRMDVPPFLRILCTCREILLSASSWSLLSIVHPGWLDRTLSPAVMYAHFFRSVDMVSFFVFAVLEESSNGCGKFGIARHLPPYSLPSFFTGYWFQAVGIVTVPYNVYSSVASQLLVCLRNENCVTVFDKRRLVLMWQDMNHGSPIKNLCIKVWWWFWLDVWVDASHQFWFVSW